MEHDVTASTDWERVLNATFEHFGSPDILVNSAGNSASFNAENIWQQQMDVHANSVHFGYAINPLTNDFVFGTGTEKLVTW